MASVTCFGLASTSSSSSSSSINSSTSIGGLGLAALSRLASGAPLSSLSLTYQGTFDLQSTEGGNMDKLIRK